MALSPAALHDALSAALHAAPRRDRWLPGRPVIWLTRPTVQIRGRSWTAAAASSDTDAYGYTARQVRQMLRALDAVLRDAAAAAEQAIAFRSRDLGLY